MHKGIHSGWQLTSQSSPSIDLSNLLEIVGKRLKPTTKSSFRDHLFTNWNALDILGRIYVAHEGINGQLSLPADHFKEFKTHLDLLPAEDFILWEDYKS